MKITNNVFKNQNDDSSLKVCGNCMLRHLVKKRGTNTVHVTEGSRRAIILFNIDLTNMPPPSKNRFQTNRTATYKEK